MAQNKKTFTEAQKSILLANPYTHSISDCRISYSLEFKQLCLHELKEGKRIQTIFAEAGYDTEILGDMRIRSFKKSLLKEANSPEGLKSPRGLSYVERAAQMRQKELTAHNSEAMIRELQDHVLHLERQIEFLKKTAAIRQKYRKTDIK